MNYTLTERNNLISAKGSHSVKKNKIRQKNDKQSTRITCKGKVYNHKVRLSSWKHRGSCCTLD